MIDKPGPLCAAAYCAERETGRERRGGRRRRRDDGDGDWGLLDETTLFFMTWAKSKVDWLLAPRGYPAPERGVYESPTIVHVNDRSDEIFLSRKKSLTNEITREGSDKTTLNK